MPGHDECEFLPSIAENLAEGYPFEARRDEPQDLVAYLMSISIVEILEVIDVHHGDGIVPPQPEDAFVKSSTARQTRQLIEVGLSPGQSIKSPQKEERVEGKENGPWSARN
jgi:hypothetical protein